MRQSYPINTAFAAFALDAQSPVSRAVDLLVGQASM
jgi:hypothetical protein